MTLKMKTTSKTTVCWQSTHGAVHIPRFRSAIHRRCGHFSTWSRPRLFTINHPATWNFSKGSGLSRRLKFEMLASIRVGHWSSHCQYYMMLLHCIRSLTFEKARKNLREWQQKKTRTMAIRMIARLLSLLCCCEEWTLECKQSRCVFINYITTNQPPHS